MTAVTTMTTLTGLGVSGGNAVGVVALVARPMPLPDEPASSDPAGDLARVAAALESVAARLEATAATLTGDAADMIGAAAAIARDVGLVEAVETNLHTMGPAHALHTAVDAYALQDLGVHRATDVVGGFAAWRPLLRSAGAQPPA